MDDFKIPLEFSFDINAVNTFPRKEDGTLAFADFAMLSMPNNTFQSKVLSMKFDNVNFQLLAGANSKTVILSYIFTRTDQQ